MELNEKFVNIINWCNLSFRNQQLHLQACWVTVDCWMHADSDTWIMALKEINSKEKYCFKFCIYACADLERGGRSGKSYPPWRIQFLVYVFVSLSYWKFEYWSSYLCGWSIDQTGELQIISLKLLGALDHIY